MLERPTNKTARAGEKEKSSIFVFYTCTAAKLEEEKHYDIFRHVIITA